MLVISWFICGMLYFLLYSYIFCELVCKEKFKISFRLILSSTLLVSIICFISNNSDISYLKPYLTHLFNFSLLLYIYRQQFVKTLLCNIFTMLILCIPEIIFGLIFNIILKLDVTTFFSTPLGYILINMFIYFQSLLLFRIKFVKKLLEGIINWYNKNEYKSLIIFIVFIVVIVTFFLYNNFMKFLPTPLLVITNLVYIGIFVFVIGFFKEKTTNNKIIYEYDQLLEYVKVYEKALIEKNKKQHEYKNQLVIIRDINKKGERNKYINNILNIEDYEPEKQWLDKLNYIPQGGLKGLIYYKIQTMLKNNISILVSVSEELKNQKLWKNFDANLSDISKIIGVYLDNAIEETEKIDEKNITISIFLENKDIIFEIANSYDGHLDTDNFDKSGYSTKGTGKGYGLPLVKDIIDKNDNLRQKRIINGGYYTQQLFIKNK